MHFTARTRDHLRSILPDDAAPALIEAFEAAATEFRRRARGSIPLAASRKAVAALHKRIADLQGALRALDPRARAYVFDGLREFGGAEILELLSRRSAGATGLDRLALACAEAARVLQAHRREGRPGERDRQWLAVQIAVAMASHAVPPTAGENSPFSKAFKACLKELHQFVPVDVRPDLEKAVEQVR